MTLTLDKPTAPAVAQMFAIDNASWELGLMIADENAGLREFRQWLRALPNR